ncbi:hypothetical protein ACXWGB_002125 [Vibrio fluvialis]
MFFLRWLKDLATNPEKSGIALAVVISLFMLIYHWPSINSWQLGDNDNYMRLHQIQTFIASPSWYVTPLKDFNYNDGQIIHWSRIVDLPILAIYYTLAIFVSSTLALKLSISIIPLIYLILLTFTLNKLIKHSLGKEYLFLGTIYILFSLVISKFTPGNIDHHNIQMLLFTTFLLSTENYTSKNSYIYSSLCISTSLTIGLETLPLFVLYLSVKSMIEINKKPSYIRFIKNTSLWTSFLGALFLFSFYPIHEIVNPRYDTISIGILFYFLLIGMALELSLFNINRTKVFIYTLVAIIISYLFFPKAISSPYSNYPELLKVYWLDHVSEAKPLWELLKTKSIFSNQVYITTVVIGVLATIASIKNKKLNSFHICFLISLIPVFFWQIRMITFTSLLEIPLLSFIGVKLFLEIKTPVIRIIIPLLLAPVILSSLVVTSDYLMNGIKEKNKTRTTFNGIQIIENLGIDNKSILASIDYGAPLLALTHNKVFSAPYHRNINGNLLFINIMLNTSSNDAFDILSNNLVDIIVLDLNSPQVKLLMDKKSDSCLLSSLIGSTPPKWADKIYSDNGLLIYNVNKDYRHG